MPTSLTASSATAPGHSAALVWFRNDLRMADHAPLLHAVKSSPSFLVPFHVIEKTQLQARRVPDDHLHHGIKLPRLGPHRCRYALLLLFQHCFVIDHGYDVP